MDLPPRMRITYNLKYRYVIRVEFGDNFLTSLSKLVLGGKASICSVIKENLLLYCTSSVFVIAVTI